jgi:hypothetical protein
VRRSLLGSAGRASRRVGNAAPFARDTARGIQVIATDLVLREGGSLSPVVIRDPPATRAANCAERCPKAACLARIRAASKHEEVCE